MNRSSLTSSVTLTTLLCLGSCMEPVSEGDPRDGAELASVDDLRGASGIDSSPAGSGREEREARRRARMRGGAVIGSLDKTGTPQNLWNGAWLGVQESPSAYQFVGMATTGYDAYDWWLVKPNGDIEFLDSTDGYEYRLLFDRSKTIASGTYSLEVDAWIYSVPMYEMLTSNGQYVPILAVTPDVGVIPNGADCPSPEQQTEIHMDNEDHNESSSNTGWVGGTRLDAAKNTTFVFCRVSGSQFASLNSTSSARSDYAVLKLGASCPSGSVEFVRFFDNEDNQNRNNWLGNISPNTNIDNTTMRFCLFRGASGYASGLPSLGFSYGVFAHETFGFKDLSGSIYTDDQDDVLFNPNDNYYDAEASWKSSDSSWLTKVNRIVSGGSNTTLKAARVKNPSCFDGICNGIETTTSCPSDCEPCGNGICRKGETVNSCLEDCDSCGNGICTWLDTSRGCPEDCNGGCFVEPCQM